MITTDADTVACDSCLEDYDPNGDDWAGCDHGEFCTAECRNRSCSTPYCGGEE